MPTFIIATSLSLLPLDWPILTSHSPHWLTHLPASLPSGLHSTYTSVCIQPPYKRPVSCIHAQPGRDTLRWHGPPSSTPARLQPAQCTVPARLHQTQPTAPASSLSTGPVRHALTPPLTRAVPCRVDYPSAQPTLLPTCRLTGHQDFHAAEIVKSLYVIMLKYTYHTLRCWSLLIPPHW